MNGKEFKKEFKSGLERKVYVFTGPETYLIKRYIKEIVEKNLNANMRAMNYFRLDDGVGIDEIRNACQTVPAFSDKKIVHVKNSNSFKYAERALALSEYINEIPDYCILILEEEKIDTRFKGVKAFISSGGAIVKFDYLELNEYIEWVKVCFKKRGIYAENKDCKYLIDCSSPEMDSVLSEVEKISLYHERRGKLSKADVDMLCSKTIKSRIFDLIDSIAKRDGKKAYEQYFEMIAIKEPVAKIMFLLSKQISDMYELKIARETKMSIEVKGKQIGLKSSYIARLIETKSRHFSLEELEQGITLCSELDFDIKRGKIEGKTALELIIGSLCKQ